MKSNFTQMEIGYVVANLAPEMNVRLTTSGNITMRHRTNAPVQFVFYRKTDGLYLRRRIDTNDPCGVGHNMNNDKPFLTIVDAVAYFKKYMAKYPKNVVTRFAPSR